VADPARPPPGTALIAAKKLKRPGDALIVDFRTGAAFYSVLVARAPHGICAYQNLCPHAHSPLERFDGRVLVQERKFVVCAMHGASFRIEDGVCVAGPGLGLSLTGEPVRVEDGIVRLK
jgi:nitrite reductase/ring-hydroxylating ferredoxin subunit